MTAQCMTLRSRLLRSAAGQDVHEEITVGLGEESL